MWVPWVTGWLTNGSWITCILKFIPSQMAIYLLTDIVTPTYVPVILTDINGRYTVVWIWEWDRESKAFLVLSILGRQKWKIVLVDRALHRLRQKCASSSPFMFNPGWIRTVALHGKNWMAHYHINILFCTNIFSFLTGKLLHTRHTLHTFYLGEFNFPLRSFESDVCVPLWSLLLVFH